jgi:hypothetical protein
VRIHNNTAVVLIKDAYKLYNADLDILIGII